MERPILFNGEMVMAILDGRKTMTRRVVKRTSSGRVKKPRSTKNWHISDPFAVTACFYGQPGDRLWVREKFCFPTRAFANDYSVMKTDDERYFRHVVYSADGPFPDNPSDYGGKWTPSIHMPRWASRITLEITEVRVERLKAISEEDAEREGVYADETYWGDTLVKKSFVTRFRDLWESINGKRPGSSWDANPWCWVVSFRVVDK